MMPDGVASKGAAGELGQALDFIAAGALPEAEASCRALLAIEPDHAQAWHLLGAIALRRGDADAAVEHCRRAIALAPGLTKAHSNLGAALLTKGRVHDAIVALRTAIDIDADFGSAYLNLGDALLKVNNVDEAVVVLERAVALQPTQALAHSNLGGALTRQKKLDEAIVVLTQAIEIDPKLAAAHNNLGNAFRWKGHYEKALAALQRALELSPETIEIYAHLGMVFRAMGRWDEAAAWFTRAIALRPDYADGAYFRSAVFLAQGRFAEGWQDYLDRYSVRKTTLPLHRRPLDRDLTGKHVFLAKDQGLGDEIFFLRFAPELKRRGAQVTYQPSGKIASMVGRLPFLDAVVSEDALPAPSDLILSVGDLPFVLGTTSAQQVPPSVSLPVLPDRLRAQKEALARLGPPPYIGVTWRAGTDLMGMLYKIIPLERLGAVLRPGGGTLLALQRAPETGEIAALAEVAGRPVHDLSAMNDQLEDMLALLALLDDYVTVSNTNVHLRAAVERSSRVLLPWPPDFRWMASGPVSPWFPTCTVYRQDPDLSWDAALRALASDLAGRHGHGEQSPRHPPQQGKSL